jgi:hypothetical protein
MTAFIVICLFWIFVLLALKLHGKKVGCASGRPFSSKEEHDEELSTDDDDSSAVSSLGLNSQAESHDNSVTKLIKKKASLNSFSRDESGEGTYPTTTNGRNENPLGIDKAVERREWRTRFCFMLAGLIALSCVPMILALAFGPMKEAAQNSYDIAEVRT